MAGSSRCWYAANSWSSCQGERVAELVEAGTARWFDAGKGRPMREWASISVAQVGAWPGLVAEAYEFVGSIGRAGGA